jgi:hypothetical protein
LEPGFDKTGYERDLEVSMKGLIGYIPASVESDSKDIKL